MNQGVKSYEDMVSSANDKASTVATEQATHCGVARSLAATLEGWDFTLETLVSYQWFSAGSRGHVVRFVFGKSTQVAM